MEQIRQLLSQLSLHLELNIAMCDMIERMEKKQLEHTAAIEALQLKVKTLSTQLSEYRYKLADDAYKARNGGKGPVK